MFLAAAVALAGGCATVAPAPDLVVRTHSPRDFTADAGTVGQFRIANACIFFAPDGQQASRRPALFPRGSRLSDDGRSIILPNGQAVAFDTTVKVMAERPPFGERDKTCGPNPVEVLGVQPA